MVLQNALGHSKDQGCSWNDLELRGPPPPSPSPTSGAFAPFAPLPGLPRSDEWGPGRNLHCPPQRHILRSTAGASLREGGRLAAQRTAILTLHALKVSQKPPIPLFSQVLLTGLDGACAVLGGLGTERKTRVQTPS